MQTFTQNAGHITIGRSPDGTSALWPLWDAEGSLNGTIIDTHHRSGGSPAGLRLMRGLARYVAGHVPVRIIDPTGQLGPVDGRHVRAACATSTICGLLDEVRAGLDSNARRLADDPRAGLHDRDRQLLLVNHPGALADGPMRQLGHILRLGRKCGASVVAHTDPAYRWAHVDLIVRDLLVAPPATLVDVRADDGGPRTAYLRDHDDPFIITGAVLTTTVAPGRPRARAADARTAPGATGRKAP